jgi:polysaccharide biosynthesis protein PslG
MGRRSRGAALAMAVAVVLIAMPGSAFGAAKGLETDITWGVSSSVQNQDASAMRDLGVGWTRLTMSWHDAEPTKKGSYNSSYLSSFDTALQLARATGSHVIIDVYQSPQWASGSGDADAPPRNASDFKDFVWAMAHRYAGQVSAWEIWNEENLPRFWGGQTNPAAYADLLKNGFWAVKSADPGAQVVFGGMSESDWQFLEAVYAAAPDIGNFFDVMGVHPYAPNTSPDYVGIQDGHITKDSFAGYREVRRVMLAHGTDKPLYFTEMGWSTTSQPNMGVSQQQQAAYTTLAWKCMQQDPYVQVGILYELRNNYWANDADDWEDQLGLTTTGWSHKPAYDAFRAVDPNQGGCTYHDVHGTPLGSGTDLVQPAAPAPAAAPTNTKKPAAKAPTIVLHVKTAAGPHSASSSKRLKTGVRFKVFGRVVSAKGGRMILTFQHRAHGKWRKGFSKTLKVKANGSFTSALLKALGTGDWRVQGHYKAAGKPAKSRFVYFKV